MTDPAPFEVFDPGIYLRSTKAVLEPGELLLPGRPSNFEADGALSHVYVTQTLAAAAWGAQLARRSEERRVGRGGRSPYGGGGEALRGAREEREEAAAG